MSSGVVSEVLPRQTELADPPVANINHILVLMSMTDPPVDSHSFQQAVKSATAVQFDSLQATRFLVEGQSTGVPVTLAVNKTDLESPLHVKQLMERVVSWGYEAVMLSCSSGCGIVHCADILKHKVSAVIGPSGTFLTLFPSSTQNGHRGRKVLSHQRLENGCTCESMRA